MSTITCTIILTKIINKHIIFFTVNSQTLEYKTEWLVFEIKSKSLHCQCEKVKSIETQKAFPFPFSFALYPFTEKRSITNIPSGQSRSEHNMGGTDSVREYFLCFSPGQSLRKQQNSCFHTLVGFERSILYN